MNYKILLIPLAFILVLSLVYSVSALQPIGDYHSWTNKSFGATFLDGSISTSALASHYSSSYGSAYNGALNWTSGNSTNAVSYIAIHPNLYTLTTGGGGYIGTISLYVCNSAGTCNNYPIMNATQTIPYSCGSTTSTLSYNSLAIAGVSVPAGGNGQWYAVVTHTMQQGCSGTPSATEDISYNMTEAYISTAGGAFVSNIVPTGQNVSAISLNILNGSHINSLNSSIDAINLNLTTIPLNASATCSFTSSWNVTSTPISCNSMTTVIVPNVFGLQSINATAQDASGNIVSNQSTFWIDRAIYNSQNLYETQNQTYSLEIWNESVAPTNYNFTLNGMTYIPSLINMSNSKYALNYTTDLPVGVNPVYFNWAYQDSAQRMTSNLNQSVSSISLAYCTSGNNNYLNFTFKNETTLSPYVTSTLVENFNYWLGSGSQVKTLSYSSAAENTSYSFCFTPTWPTLYINGTITYGNSYSITRNYNLISTALTNSTTYQTLYLLPTILGVYARFVTLTGAGGVLSGVNAVVTRILNGNTISIGQGTSDSSGLFAIFVDPTASYNFIFSKSGYTTNTFSLIPNNNQNYNVYMGSQSASTQVVNGSTIGNNLSIDITPYNSSLSNNTVYTFGFNVTGLNIISISENITNSTGQQLGYVNGTNGYISISINTLNNSFLLGTYIVQTPTESYTYTHTWLVTNYYVGTYSLYALMTSWNQYGFKYDYFRIIFMLLVLMGSIGGLSKLEITDTTESKIWTGVFIVWIFSYVGWLSIPSLISSPSSPLYNISQYASQYAIAILASVFSLIAIKETIT